MTRQPPPTRFSGRPQVGPLAAGTMLSRVHPVQHDSTDFKPVPADILFGGGRFDSTAADPYGYLYAGESDQVAVAESLLRDIDANDRGARFLAKKYWRERQLSRIHTTADITLVRLRTGTELGAIGQDAWLTTCDPDDYPQSRAWSHWLRAIVPNAAGLIWFSKREPGKESLVLFEDRCPPGLLMSTPGPLPGPCEFDKPEGFAWLRATLVPYRVSIRR